jgi:hypothetical protein
MKTTRNPAALLLTRFAASSGMPAAKRYSDIALIGDVESKVLLRKVYCYEL